MIVFQIKKILIVVSILYELKREDYYFEIHVDAPLNTPLPAQREDCPPFSTLNNNMCTCDNRFHPSANLQECGKRF
jgi:hypothetical protein